MLGNINKNSKSVLVAEKLKFEFLINKTNGKHAESKWHAITMQFFLEREYFLLERAFAYDF